MEGLEKSELAKINARLKMLADHGEGLLPSLLTPVPRSRHLQELVIGGRTAIRILLCRGPTQMGSKRPIPHHRKSSQLKEKDEEADRPKEFTLLLGAKERDRKYVPSNAVQKAEERRQIVLNDPSRRREHEEVGP